MPNREPPAGASLDGVHVLVTRPAHQSEPLREAIERDGGVVSVVPVIEIAGPPDPQAVAAVLERLDELDLAIFVSANAVERTFAMPASRRSWPAIAAVGRATAAAVERHGNRVDLCPARRFDSEGLLAEPPLQRIAGQRIAIFRGEGGRELLTDTLRERGAEVTVAEVYRRRVPAAAAAALRDVAAGRPVDVIVVTSNEGLRNLQQIAGEALREWLLDRRLVVISARTAEFAAGIGFRQPVRVATEASNEGLLAVIRESFSDTRRNDGEGVHRVH